MPIDSLGALSALPPLSSLPAVTSAVQPTLPTSAALPGALPASVSGTAGPTAAGTDAVSAASEAQAGSFGTQLANQVDGLQALQGERDTLTLQAVTGDLQDIHEATIASAEASATMDLMVALRNSGLQAFNELMRIQA